MSHVLDARAPARDDWKDTAHGFDLTRVSTISVLFFSKVVLKKRYYIIHTVQ